MPHEGDPGRLGGRRERYPKSLRAPERDELRSLEWFGNDELGGAAMTSPALSLDGFSDHLVTDRLRLSPEFQPISMAFLPDNRMLLLSKSGEIRLVDPESGSSSVYMQLTNINGKNERGLLDITLDPDFETNGYFYLYYTPGSPQHARVARFQHQENGGGLSSTGDLSSEFRVWEDTDAYLSCCHYGGGLDFGIDGKLWLSTSDKFQTTAPGEGTGGTDLPVDLASSSGKIIRINSDGTIPDGTDGWAANPYIDGPGGNDDSVWAYGLRNPFRARWDHEYGHFYVAEVGGNQQNLSHEDLHLAGLDQRGVFYGWPYYEGAGDTLVNDQPARATHPLPDGDLGDPANGDYYSSPIWSLPHATLTSSPKFSSSLTGGEVYRGSMFPSAWDGVYFYGDYTRDYIRYLILDETGTEVLGDHAFRPSAALPGTTNEVVSITVGPDGALYYAMIATGEVRRIVHGPINEAPTIGEIAVSPLAGDPPLAVTFSTTVADAEGDALAYEISFGDGATATGTVGPDGLITVQHLYETIGRYTISLELADATHTVFSAPVEVEVGDVNDPPVIEGERADRAFAEPGVTEVTFTATVADEDGDPLTYTWHFGDGHSVSGHVPSDGVVTARHVYAENSVYEAYLEVSDGEALVSSDRVTVQVGVAGEVPVTYGLGLLLESDIKIGLQGSTVLAWLDGSGNGNNLFAAGNPQLVANQTPTGRAAIVLDGEGDLLQRVGATDPLLGLSTSSADRTIFAVVDYVAPERTAGGVVYGDAATNEAFGIVANKTGKLAVQGFGTANDFASGVDGVAGGFLVQSVVLSSDTTFHYRNGALIDSDAHVYATDLKKLVLGAEINGRGQSQMKFGAVLIYNRALSDAERQQVEAFLQDKYITGPRVPLPPEADDDAAGTTAGTPVEIDVLANDDANGDPLAITSIGVPAHGTATLLDNGTPDDPSDDRVLYTAEAGFVGQDSFTYAVANAQGADTATVTVTVAPPAGSSPPSAAPDTASTAVGVPVLIDVLANDGDPDGDPVAITGVTAPAHGTAAVDDNGTPDDPSDDFILYTPAAGFTGQDSFGYTIADDDGTATATVTVTVTPEPDPNQVPVAEGLVALYEADQNVTLAGGATVAGWLDGSGRGNDLIAGGNPTLVAGATPTGQAAIALDGTGDLLERVNAVDTLNGLPSGAADRTMFFVVNHGASLRKTGLAYGDGAANEAFGLVADPADKSLVHQGFGRRHDYDTGAVSEGWGVQSVVLRANDSDIYRNGQLVGEWKHAFATDLQRLVIGEEIGGLGTGQMDVAAALIYDRALSEAERAEVETYLQQKYVDDDFLFA